MDVKKTFIFLFLIFLSGFISESKAKQASPYDNPAWIWGWPSIGRPTPPYYKPAPSPLPNDHDTELLNKLDELEQEHYEFKKEQYEREHRWDLE